MENALQKSRPSDAPARDISVITAEIRDIRRQANAMALIYAVEIGRRLVEAKEALPYGEWGRWLKEEAEFSQSTANNFMRLFEEYGSAQISIFGASVDSQTFANLPYSKALSLLAVPAEEREEFAEEVHADELSVRELKAAIEERDKAQKMAEAQKKLKEEATENWKKAEAAREEAQQKAYDAEKLAASAGELQKRLYELEAQTLHEKTAAKELQRQLDEAKANPKIPKATLEKLKKEATEAAQKAASEAAKKELEAAQAKAEKATAEAIKAKNAASEAERRAAEAERKLKTASPEVAAFKALFDSVQASVQKLRGMIETVRGTDPETADKLAKALHAFGASL